MAFDYRKSQHFQNMLYATSSMYKVGSVFDADGAFTNTRFRNDDSAFTIAKFEPDDQKMESIYCVGKIFGYTEGSPYHVRGKVVMDKRYGVQVSIEEARAIKPTGERQIKAFLACGLFKGIGTATAQKIYDTFGDATLDILQNDPDRLDEVPGLRKSSLESYKKTIPHVMRFQQTISDLSGFGISMTTIKRLIDQYGDNASDKVMDNPYILTKVRGFQFTRADQIARKIGFALDDKKRLDAGIISTLRWAKDQYGHTLLPTQELVDLSYDKLEMQSIPNGVQKLDVDLDDLTEKKQLIKDDDGIHLPFVFKEEKTIEKSINSAARPDAIATREEIESAIKAVEDEMSIEVTDEQLNAVYNVFNHKLSVITGSAGCGKTAVCRLIVKVIRHLGYQMCLMSPTGRAAKHMSDVCDGEPAYTMHRALALTVKEAKDDDFFDDDSVEHINTTNDATVQFMRSKIILIDEASMLDTDMVYALLKQARDKKHIVMIGDCQQLPPVGAGQPFYDIINSRSAKVTRLTKIFRQAEGSPIIVAANQVLDGKSPCFVPGIHFIECSNDQVQQVIAEQVLPQIMDDVRNRDVMFLSPMKKTPVSGVNALNEFLRPIANPRYKQPEKDTGGRLVLQPGDIVMQTKNNYDCDVFNGDLGVVAAVRPDKSVVVDFDNMDAPVEYEPNEIMENLQLAYAMTVHKSQGSQARVVVGVFTDSFYIMASPNILYTLVTRAEQELYLVGSSKMFAMAAKNKQQSERYTGLKHL